MSTVAENVSRVIVAFEQSLGVAVSIYDLTGRMAGCLPSDKTTHRHPYCQAVILANGPRCGRFDCFVMVPEALRKQPTGFFKHCHGDVLEYVQGLWREKELIGTLLIGQFRRPQAFASFGAEGRMLEASSQVKHLGKSVLSLHRTLPEITRRQTEYLPVMATALAARLLEIIPASPPVDRSDRQRRWVVDDFLARRFSHPETALPELARVLGLSEDRARHIVKKLYGDNFTQVLTTYRLDHARYLLATTNMTVTQLAGHCGYADAHHFHRMFRLVTGMTPLEFRAAATARAK